MPLSKNGLLVLEPRRCRRGPARTAPGRPPSTRACTGMTPLYGFGAWPVWLYRSGFSSGDARTCTWRPAAAKPALTALWRSLRKRVIAAELAAMFAPGEPAPVSRIRTVRRGRSRLDEREPRPTPPLVRCSRRTPCRGGAPGSPARASPCPRTARTGPADRAGSGGRRSTRRLRAQPSGSCRASVEQRDLQRALRIGAVRLVPLQQRVVLGHRHGDAGEPVIRALVAEVGVGDLAAGGAEAGDRRWWSRC